jgi:serine/threonine protein kinase
MARFDAERQALAMMDHPNMAKVLDAGATETGRPYFVMELVRGIKITDFCDQHRLSSRERLELFVKVCRAIQHAHQKGIIHRDIKPSNILVTSDDGVAVPKVATSFLEGVRDGTNAVAFAEKAVAATGRTNATYLDTLAAGYAETADFQKPSALKKKPSSWSPRASLNPSSRVVGNFTKLALLFESNGPSQKFSYL